MLRGAFGTQVKDLLGLDPYSYPVEEPSSFLIDPSHRWTPDGEPWITELAGSDQFYYKYENYASAVDAYNRCPPVNAIINRKAQAFVNGWTWVLNTAGKEATSADAKMMKALLDRPNPLQSRKQFEAQGYIYQQLFGFNIILPTGGPSGFGPLLAKALWNIPASWIDFDRTKEIFTRAGGVTLEEIVLTFNNQKVTLRIKDLIIIKDFTPSFSTLIFPGSKLLAMAMPINNIIGAYESVNTLIRKRGPSGILTSDPGTGQFVPMPMTDPEKKSLQRDFAQYGLLKGQIQAILTTATLKWQAMGSNVKDLMLHEGIREDTIAICNGTNFPPFMLGFADTTYNNMNEAAKGLYQNSIIPDAESWAEQMTAHFLGGKNLWLNKDFSKIPVLQQDNKTLAEARKALNDACAIEWEHGLITLNEWRARLGDDPLPDQRGTLYIDEYKKQYGAATQPAAIPIPGQEEGGSGGFGTESQDQNEAA